MMTRRNFLNRSVQAGLVTATSTFWSNPFALRALAQMPSNSYKALVVITLAGGNDANNTLIPIDSASYAEYSKMRGALALPIASCIPLLASRGGPTYGMHPSLANVAALYNSGRALAVVGVGPLGQPATKAQLLANTSLIPASLNSHTAGRFQWESAQTVASPLTGWGGRIADIVVTQSGSLPPILNAGPNSIFSVGSSVQAVTLQSGDIFTPLPSQLNNVILQLAQDDSNSGNALVQQVAKFRTNAMKQQVILDQAAQAGAVQTSFPSGGFGQTMKKITQIINSRSILGASRQIFYAQQGGYDTHGSQLQTHAQLLRDLDAGIGAFFTGLDAMGLSDQVLLCTHSDFCRTMAANSNAGSDHAWASHQLMLGGGIRGGRILGTLPDLEFGGSSDLTASLGMWIPTTSVTQMAAGIGNWMGLTSPQLTNVFPDLVNFPSGMIQM